MALLETATIFDDPEYFFQNSENQTLARKFAASINDLELSSEISYWVHRLENIGGHYSPIFAHRTRYLWKWVQTAFEVTSLKIPNEHFTQAQSLKCRVGFLAILLDDICDVGQSEKELQAGVNVMMGLIPSKGDDPLYHLIYDLWVSINHDIESSLNYRFLHNDITLAYKKLSDSYIYGLSIPKRLLAGEKIWHFYLDIIPHSICVYLAGLIDLLYTPQLPSVDLDIARNLFENTQKMAQIGNWLSTYVRELKQNDLSSGIIVLGLEKEWLNYKQLKQPMSLEEIILVIKKSPVEKSLLDMWKTLQNEGYALREQCDEHLFKGYVERFSTVLLMQMGSVGLT